MGRINYLIELKKAGNKLTAPRRKILNVLSENLLSPNEVWKLSKKKGLDLDLVTVYRTLELFYNLGLVNKTQFEKCTKYELSSHKHHHHLVCIKCGFIEDLVTIENALMNEIEKQSQFKIQRHALEFFGYCKGCQ